MNKIKVPFSKTLIIFTENTNINNSGMMTWIKQSPGSDIEECREGSTKYD